MGAHAAVAESDQRRESGGTLERTASAVSRNADPLLKKRHHAGLSARPVPIFHSRDFAGKSRSL
jgi:hypothetical protein